MTVGLGDLGFCPRGVCARSQVGLLCEPRQSLCALEVVPVIGFDALIDRFGNIRSRDFSSSKDFAERDTKVFLPR